jgi:hypothetical protein
MSAIESPYRTTDAVSATQASPHRAVKIKEGVRHDRMTRVYVNWCRHGASCLTHGNEVGVAESRAAQQSRRTVTTSGHIRNGGEDGHVGSPLV